MNDVDYQQLADDVRNWSWKKWNSNDFLKGLILGVAPSAADIITDFCWAGKQWEEIVGRERLYPGLSYLFISSPGIILLMTWLRNLLYESLSTSREGGKKILESQKSMLRP